MNFPGFLGNKEVKELFSDAFDADRFPHAIVLQGEDGTGKRTFAGLLAKALVCRDKKSAPCGVCPSCIRANAGSHPDIRIEEGSGATRSLNVETAKNIISDAYRVPEEADYSIYLLFVENRMSDAVQNKLLKIIEEPPKGAVFIITCRNSEILLPTIRSRSQIYTLNAPNITESAKYAEESMGLEAREALKLAELCWGNIGRMQQEISDGEAYQVQEIAEKIAAAVVSSREQDILEKTSAVIKDRSMLLQVLARLEKIFRDALVYRLSGQAEPLQELTGLSVKRLTRLIELTEDCRKKLERNANMTLLVTWFCAALRERAGK